ncbi:hypothetical protein GPECTOR_8g247 [Gonium pectorale]|uniref:Uncharacterized protein n=1 Tax=Gonium pectorale TaxID=33097 RepID=A0A150GSN6_GONPE|nr:hypothetical protein GPECTOR_8g247 [Gonium pectorale]|eukprot:KXZ52865.1 hypothetical protein GPECTOR_8g247 [Gonium pectorale]
MAASQATPAEDADTTPRCASRVFAQLPPELTELIVSRLDPNQVACCVRPLNRAAAAQFAAPCHTTIRLSRPVPPHAFSAHWLTPGAVHDLSLRRRNELLSFTAYTGVLENLQVAVRAVGWEPSYEAFDVHDAVCYLASKRSHEWLSARGCPVDPTNISYMDVLSAAASGGHAHVCDWLCAHAPGWAPGDLEVAARAAACSGHLTLADSLLQRAGGSGAGGGPSEESQFRMVASVALGCDLASLRDRIDAGGWGQLESDPDGCRKHLLAAASSSPTPDWGAKVEWLEAQGCPRSVDAAEAAVGHTEEEYDTVARLTWLRDRGYPIDGAAVEAASYTGNVAAVKFLLAELPYVDPLRVACPAAWFGHLEVLQALRGAGLQVPGRSAALCAADGGHLHVLMWLMEDLGEEAVPLDEELFDRAAGSGSVELMAWLRQRGFPWGVAALPQAAGSGCETAVAWLLEQGCPMEVRMMEEGWGLVQRGTIGARGRAFVA